MKKYLLLTVVLCICSLSWAQYVPQSFSYQAVARDAKGLPIVNEEIVVEISIIKDSSDGTVAWQEVHYPISNDFGLFSVNIGKGESTYGGSETMFSDITWTDGPHFVKVRVDFGKSEVLNGFMDMGTIQLQSVPYALVADYALSAPIPNLIDLKDVDATSLQTNDVLKWDGTKWITSIAIDPDTYLRRDGTTDLLGDWSIDRNSIELNYGSITLQRGKLNSPDVVVKNINLNSKDISDISTDPTFASATDNSIASSKAIRDYVLSKTSSGGAWTTNTTDIYNTDKNIGIGTIPQYKFHSNVGTSSFYLEGENINSASFPNLNSGTYMVFSAGKSALRVGTVEAGTGAWTSSNVGEYSQAFGRDTQATGDYSTAFGYKTKANGTYSVVFGNQNQINFSESAFATGHKNIMNGASYSAVFGDGNTAEGIGSLAIGTSNIVAGDNSFVMGIANKSGNTTTSRFSNTQTAFAGGTLCEAKGDYSFAYGYNNFIDKRAEGAFNLGKNNRALSSYSFTLGENLIASGYLQTSIGRNNVDHGDDLHGWIPNDYIFVIGNGASDSDRSNALAVYKSGNTEINGTLTVQGSAVTSDKRYKKSIVPLTNALPKIQQLEGVSYYWKQQKMNNKQFSSTKQIGLIAQDVEKLFPELVITDHTGYKAVNYTGLIPVLIEALKEQQKEIDALKQLNTNKDKKAATLSAKVDQVTERLAAIEQLLLQSISK